MRKKALLAGSAAALMAAAGVGGMAIAGDTGEREAGRVVLAEPITATEKGPVTRAGKGGKIQTFYLNNALVPDEGEGSVVGGRCPNNAGGAIGGGAATSEGIVLSYLSQIQPSSGERSDRVYWIGVDDNSESNPDDAGAIIEVHCAKGIKVEK